MNHQISLLQKLESTHALSYDEWTAVFDSFSAHTLEYLSDRAHTISTEVFGTSVYLRGLIEISNYCRNDCHYCGIRCGNPHADRYRMTKDEILFSCRQGYGLGLRTFVLQGGEDMHYSDDDIANIVASIKRDFPDCAVTLSLGERSEKSYMKYFDAGADRYLLRHETADDDHYSFLHPAELTLKRRMDCLWSLKKIGYQTGTGFMVGSPGQTNESLAKDMLFIQEFQPHMIGIGPFVPHRHTDFADCPAGSEELTLYCIGLLRLMMPNALIPATTALSTVSKNGPQRGILAGANVIMPNLTPAQDRAKYSLYDNIACTGSEAAEGIDQLRQNLNLIGYTISSSRGDHPSFR